MWFVDRVLARHWPEQREPFRVGLSLVQRQVQARSPGARDFAALPAEAQDAVLQSIETDPFFDVLRGMTLAGLLASPQYGGNRDHVGWTLVGHTGGPTYAPPFGYYDEPEHLRQLRAGR